jgi:hypothetical protein
MTIADDIEALVNRKRRLSLTEEDIADMLFGQNNALQQRVNSACRQLVAEKRLVRQGNGRTRRSLHVPSPTDQTTS